MLQPRDFFWALVGLSLTVGLTQIQGAIYLPHWENGLVLKLYPLNVRLQIVGVLLTAYLGGGTSGALSQTLYLLLGVIGWGGLQVFGDGGGLNYWQKPTFGYLVGFIPGSFLAGFLSFSIPKDVINFAWSGILCLVTIHLIGMGYIALQYGQTPQTMLSHWFTFSINILPDHLTIVCGCSLLAYLIRLLLLY